MRLDAQTLGVGAGELSGAAAAVKLRAIPGGSGCRPYPDRVGIGRPRRHSADSHRMRLPAGQILSCLHHGSARVGDLKLVTGTWAESIFSVNEVVPILEVLGAGIGIGARGWGGGSTGG